MSRNAFSGTEGVGVSLGYSHLSDSSSLSWTAGIQHIWGSLITTGSALENGLEQRELLQSRQSNLKLGIGYRNRGKHKYSVEAGPLIPFAHKSFTSIFVKGNGNEYIAHYSNKFFTSLGAWAAIRYDIALNKQISGFIGLGGQLLNRQISKRELSNFVQVEGTVSRQSYAPQTYHQQYTFLKTADGELNDALINSGSLNLDEPRELITQSYSFSSIFVQFGMRYQL